MNRRAFQIRQALMYLSLPLAALGLRVHVVWLALPMIGIVVLALEHLERVRERAGEDLAVWAHVRGAAYSTDAPARRSPTVLRAGARQRSWDRLHGFALGGLPCEIFNFDWLGPGLHRLGNRWARHHPCLVLSTTLPQTVPVWMMSLDQRGRGPLARFRDQLRMPRMRGARDVYVENFAPGLRLRVRDHADDGIARSLMTGALVRAMQRRPRERYGLSLQIEGNQLALVAWGAHWTRRSPEVAEWMVDRARPILAAAVHSLDVAPPALTPLPRGAGPVPVIHGVRRPASVASRIPSGTFGPRPAPSARRPVGQR